MKAKRILALFLFLILYTVSLFAQPAWFGGTPTVTPKPFSIEFNYGITTAGKVYVILINFNYTTPVPTSLDVKNAAIAGPTGGRISTWVIDVPDANKNNIFTINARNQIGGNIDLIPNHDYTFYFVAADPAGVPLQAIPVRILTKTLPCPKIDILTGFSQPLVCLDDLPTATFQVVLSDPPTSGILKGTQWTIDWGDGNDTTYLSAADYDIPSIDLRRHVYSSTTSCNYVFSSSVRNPCGETRSVQYVAVVHGKDDQGDGILQIVNNATGSSVVEVCEGVSTNITLQDNSTWNCQSPVLPGGLVPVPNNDSRNIEWLYGQDPSGGGASTIAGVLVGGVAAPVSSGRIAVPTSSSLSEVITIPATATSGQYFRVYLKNWNKCNWENPDYINTYVDILVVPAPPAPTAPSKIYCVNDTKTLYVTSAPAGTITWYSNPGLTVVEGTGITFTPVIATPGTYTYYVTDKQSSGLLCQSAATTVTLTVNPKPATPTLSGVKKNDICFGVTPPESYVITATATATPLRTGFAWFLNGVLLPGRTSDTLIVRKVEESGLFRAASVGVGPTFCLSDLSDTLRVTVHTLLNVTNPLPQAICENGTAIFFATTTEDIATWHWEVSFDGGTTWSEAGEHPPYSGSFTNTLTLTMPPASYNGQYYRLEMKTPNGQGGCAFKSDKALLTVDGLPTANAGAPIIRCSATPLTPIPMTGATKGGTSSTVIWSGGEAMGTWTQNTNPALATFTPSIISGSFVATLTVTGTANCGGVVASGTRNISWSLSPAVEAGPNLSRCDGAPLATFTMTGASASGSYGTLAWSGGSGLGTWTQDANPALATFTPSVTSGSFTATLTITGIGTCAGTNPSDTKTISWAQAPVAVPGPDINRCNLTPTAPIVMTGALSSGTFVNQTWSGGAGLGNWTQNANPALAVFTPTTNSGSFTATLSLTGSGACTGTNVSVTKIVAWSYAATVNAGPDQSICATASVTLAGTRGGAATSASWSGGTGIFVPNNTTLNAVYTPSAAEQAAHTVTLILTTNDPSGICPAVTDDITISIGTLPTSAVLASPNDACFGDGPSYMNLVITGGAPPYTISYKLDGVVKPNITNYYSSTNALLGTLAVGTHTLEITNIKDGCNNNMPLAGLPGLRTFIIYQKPVSNPGSDKGVCNTLDAGLSATPSTGTGTWSVVSSPAGGSINFLPGINSPNVTARANDYGSFVVRWTEVNGVCSSFRDIIVAYEKQAAAGAAQNLCGTLSVTLAGNISSAGIGTWTKVSGPVGSTVSFSPNANAPDAVATVSEFGTYIFRWTLTNPVLPNCSTSSDVTITLEKAANAGVEQRLCGTFAATLAGNIPAVGTGTWSLVGGPGGVTFTPDVNTPAATATVTTYGTYVFRWIVSNGVFCSTNDDVTVIYNPAGQVNPVAGQVLCNGNSTTDVIFSTVNAGGTTTYAWTNSAPGIGLPGAGSGDILSFPVVNTGTAPVIATLEVIPTYSDGVVFCPGPKETFTITVNPPAQVNKPADRVFCNGFITPVINFTTVNTIGTTTYSWSNSDPSIGLAAGGTDFIPTFTAVNTGFSPVTATITVVPVFTYAGRGCPGASETFTITINPSGQVIQPLNLVICHNNPGGVTFATNNLIGTTSYHWTNDNTATGLPASGDGQISFSGTNAGTEPITGNISVTPTFTFAGISCPGSPKTFTITVNPAGQVDQPADLPVCNGETGSVTFTTVNTVGTTTYSWTNSNTDIGLGLNGTGPISFIATNPNTFPISALIEVTPTFNFNGTDCPGTPKTFTITINPTPKLISSLTPADVCSNSLFSYTPLSSTAFTAFDWSRAMVAGITPAGPTSGADNPNETLRNLTNIPIGVTYQYILTANGCANTQNVIVNIKPEPVIEPDQTANICSGITTNHFIRLVNFTNPGDNVTFTWPAPVLSPADPRFTGGAERSTASSVNIADVFVNTMGVNGTATYTITPFKNGCAGTPETIIMTVRSQPVLDTSLGGIFCSNSPISLVLQVAAGSVPATFFNISGVTLDAGLSADAGNATISNTTAPAGYLSNDKYLNITGVNKNVTYRVQPVYAPDCFGDAVDVVVTIRPQPYIVPAQTKTVCSGIAIGKEILLSPVNTPAGSLFNWGIPAMSDGSVQGTAGGNVPADPAGTFHINDIIDNAKGIVITATYSITAVSPEGCTSGAPVTVVIYVNPEPLVKVISGDDKICINEKNLVYSVASEPTSTFHWAVPPAIGTKTFDYNTSSIILDAAAVAGSGNITVYETNSYGCDGDMSSYTVNVYTQAVPEAVTGPNDVCAYSTATYSVTSRAGSVYSWSIPGGAAIIGDPSAASVQVAFGNVGGNISVRETNIAGCLTNHTPLTVSVKARPTAIISGGGTICEGGTIALSVDLNGTAPFVFRYAVNGGAPVTVTTSADPYALDATLAGTYTIVDVTDATGCMNNGLGSAFVGYYPKPVGVLSGGATLCGGAGTTLTITITGGTQPFAFAYTDGTTTYSIPEWWGVVYTSTVSPAATVTYTLVSLSDGHSCNGAISGSALVTVNTPPALTLNPTNLTCYNDYTGAVDLTVAGSAPFGIVWTGPLGFTANTEDITLLRAGTYNVTVTDTKGCISTGSVTLTEPGSVNANVTSTDIICFGAANGSITISSASGGSGVYEYTIDGGLSWVGTGNFTGLVPGNYDVRIRDIAAPVCNKILNPALAITSPAILNATVVHSDILCYGANNGSITISNPSGGFGTFGYSVDGGSNWQGSGNFNDLVPGTYHVWIRDAAHPLCIIVLESPLDITAPPLLTATVNSTNISCFGSTDGTISITAPSGGHGTFEYSINGGGSWQPSGLYTGLAPGTYNIQIRDKDYPTCYKVIDGMLSITQPAVLKATVSSSMATCNSKNDGTISITGPSGGSGNYQYTISGGLSWEISGLYSNLIPGSYDVRIRDAASTSCEIILNNGLLITQPPALSATVIKTNITCNGEDDGTIIITNSSGGYGTFDYSIDGGLGWQPSNSFINLGSGTHSVWIRDRVQTTCSLLLDPAVVIFEPAPLVASLDSTNVTCFNANNGTITISAAGGGSGAYQYSINGGGTWFGSGNFINLGPGSYNVIMRDAVNTGCFITLDPALVLSEPSALSASPASTNVTCFGLSDGTITISNPLGGAGSYEYTINGGSTWQLSGSYTGLISGNYNVQIRDVLHPTCVTVLNNSLSISQPGILYSTVTPTMISCNGANDGIINLTGPSGGYGTYEYSINGGTDWQSSGMFSSLTPGFYNVRIRDGSYNTCVITLNGSLEITQPGVVGASLAYSNITCNGNNDGAITISSPTGGYGTFDYTINGWSTWQGSGSFTNLAPGLYNVQIRDRAHTSCVTTLNGNLSLSQPDALTGTVTGTNITCNGANNGKITISGGSGGYGTFEYSIDGGVTWQSPNVFNGLLPGSYGAMIRDAAHISCSASLGSISISQPGPLSGSAAGTNITCAGADDGIITISSVSGGYGLYEYTIDGGGTWQSSDSFTYLAPGFYNVQMRDKDNPGCTKIINSSLRITEPATLNADYNKSDITCNGLTNGRITITIPAGGSGFYEFTISGGAPWQASGTFTGLSAGTYNVQIRDAIHTGCIKILNPALQITEPEILNASVNFSDLTCNGISDGTINISGATGGYGTYQYSINGGTAWFSSGSFSSLAAGTYDIWMLDASNPACRIRIDPAVLIAEPDPLNATLARTNVTCFGSGDGTITISAPLGGYGNYEFTINGGGSWQSSGNFTGLGPGNYNVMMRDADHNACIKMLSSSYNITQPAQLNGVITRTMVTCNGADDGIINITSPSGGYGLYEYSINGGTDWFGSGLFTSLAPDIYDVKIRDASNISCIITLNSALAINEPTVLGANVTSSDITCNGADDGTINISFATGGYGTYEYRISGSLWQGTGYFSGLAPDTYVVEIRDKAHPSCVIVLNPGLVLTEPPVLSASVSFTAVSCFGANNGTITITDPIGGYGTYAYSVNGGSAWQSSGIFTNLAPGNYDVRIRDASSPACVITLDPAVSITEPSVLSASVASANVTCYNASDGAITVSSPSGGYGTWEFSVNGGTTWQVSGNFTGLAPGFYNVKIRDAAHIDCSVVLNGSLRITEPGILAAIVTKTNVTCFGSNNGTIAVTGASGGYGSYEYSIDGGGAWQSSGSFANLIPGNYDVRIRDGLYNGCVMTLNPAVSITEPALLDATVTATMVTCSGANDGIITVSSPSGGSGSYLYSVNGGTSWQGYGTFNNIAPGNYDVMIKDAANPLCIILLEPALPVTQPGELSATISRTNVSCFGGADGSITISSPAGGYGSYEFSINGGGTWQSSGLFTDLMMGSYNILIRDATHINCMKVLNSSYLITQPGFLTATVSKTDITCNGSNNGIITISSPSGGYGTYEYSVNGGMSWQVSGNYTGLIPGIYSVRMRDAAHTICWMNLNSTLVISEPLVLSMTSTGNIVLNCNGDNNGAGSFFAAGGTMPYTFTITSNTTGATIPAQGFNSQSFTGAGAGTITVQITDSHGCTSQATIAVSQPAILTPGSIATNQVLCSGQNPAQLTEATPATGGPAAYNYQWQYGVNIAGPFINIAGGTTYQYTPPANATTTLYYRRMVTSGSCAQVYSNIVEVKVNPVPFAVLSGGETICPGQSSILIVNISSGVGPFEVVIENQGTVSGYNSGGNISVSPASTTTYKLLRVRDSNGCEVTSPTTNLSGFATVVVRSLPVITTSPSSVITCELNMASFTVAATGSDLTYQWYVDEGSGFNPVTDGGIYYGANYNTLSIFGTTRLMNNNRYHVLVTGCGITQTSADAVLSVNTVPEITDQPSDTTICMNGGASFTVSATGTAQTYRWQVNTGSGFGDISDNINYNGTNSSNLVLSAIPGTFNNYTFRVKITGTCGVPIYSNFVVLRVLTPPSVTLNPGPKSVCNGGGPVVFSATGTGLIDSIRWQVYSGGTWSDIHDNSVYSGTSSQQLTLNSVPLAYNGNQYRLALKGRCITISSAAATLTVNPNPVVDFSAVSPLNACGGVPLVINGNPTGGSGSYIQHTWTGDAGPLNNYFVQSPSFNTIIPGTYNLNYKVKDSNGCFADDDMTVLVDKPDAAFSQDAAFGCTPVMTTFSKDMTGIDKFWWNFDDGSPADSVNTSPSHLFTNTNPSSIEYYNVTLKVQSSGGCTDSFTSIITVYPEIDATFSTNRNIVCSGESVTFTASTPGASRYFWKYGDGISQTTSSEFTSHIYTNFTTAPVVDTVQLVTTSFYNCTDTSRITVTVMPVPMPQFSAAPALQVFNPAGNPVVFTDMTNAGTWNYSWRFGDGASSASQNPSHTYTSVGDFNVVLSVSNSNCSDSIKHTVHVTPIPPIADFDQVPSACAPLAVRFNNTSLNTEAPGTTYRWDFGDGNYSSVKNPSYTYYTSGIYRIELTVTGPGGTSVKSQIVEAYESPEANFKVSPSLVFVNDESVRCFNLSQNGDSYIWEFGDGDTSKLKEPFHKYMEEGIYDITLWAYSDNGCSDVFILTPAVTVEPAGELRFSTVFTPNKDGPIERTDLPTGGTEIDQFFFPPVREKVINYKLQIFNRWGVLIFESRNINIPWNGYYKGKLCPQGVYVWYVEGKYANGRPFRKAGDVTLLH